MLHVPIFRFRPFDLEKWSSLPLTSKVRQHSKVPYSCWFAMYEMHRPGVRRQDTPDDSRSVRALSRALFQECRRISFANAISPCLDHAWVLWSWFKIFVSFVRMVALLVIHSRPTMHRGRGNARLGTYGHSSSWPQNVEIVSRQAFAFCLSWRCMWWTQLDSHCQG
ncbi:hypothetical protein K469DRAFT_253497 [Zopfia rhizophila CBS 207.26]|uniref:Uncharacterized protein n=1 Tax=Zopfia rhizophila CBS 207.26 TaxID=1314779 RepID=A0A6A6DWM5_9PEZI|nr:hypothetical protein K469DRAFT_253497 [Zopfia rhizophila CBS 207.26]